MTHWTLMLITFIGGPIDGSVTAIPYPSDAACRAAIVAVTDTLGQDYNVRCQPTPTLSSALRPKRRPW